VKSILNGEKSVSKRYISEQEMKTGVLDIVSQMYSDDWRPDIIVGVTRGGLIPAVMMSHYTGIRMETIDVRLRDTFNSPEHALWMAEEAGAGKRILILDDINDTGETFKWIVKDWEESNPPADWVDIWGNNVRFATIIDNAPSAFDVDYTSIEINKAEDPAWIVFPFEEWW
jgi:hypoxanthine phosphoribosyltransferase